MVAPADNWKTQIRKGYLEMCIFMLIGKSGRLYGFEILELLEGLGMPVKEGTMYPLLNRLTTDGYLKAIWETENLKGHPRKYYSLTASGTSFVGEMEEEFSAMVAVFKDLSKGLSKGKSKG